MMSYLRLLIAAELLALALVLSIFTCFKEPTEPPAAAEPAYFTPDWRHVA